MAQRSGSATLPLHSGYVPKWLAGRTTKLGAVMGMDWHSSGITTGVFGIEPAPAITQMAG